MIYDTNWCPDGSLSNSTGIEAWWDQEHIPYNLAFDNTTFNQVCALNWLFFYVDMIKFSFR